jgi:hypothetical protein
VSYECGKSLVVSFLDPALPISKNEYLTCKISSHRSVSKIFPIMLLQEHDTARSNARYMVARHRTASLCLPWLSVNTSPWPKQGCCKGNICKIFLEMDLGPLVKAKVEAQSLSRMMAILGREESPPYVIRVIGVGDGEGNAVNRSRS